LFNFGVSFAPHRPELNVFRFDRGGTQVFRSRIALHCSCSIHDFALGPSYAVFYVSPYVIDMPAIAAGATVLQALAWKPHLGSRIIVVSRETGAEVCSIPIEGRYSLHTINCAETGGLIVFDVVEMPAPIYDAYSVPGLFARPIETVPVRFEIDPARGVITSREALPCHCAPEFATVEAGASARECPRFWALGMSNAWRDGTKFFDQVVRFRWDRPLDRDTCHAPHGTLFGGEPLVLAEPGREDGWVLCQVLDTELHRGGFTVFDAFDLRRGPLATLWLDRPTPMAFHGTFVPKAAA
jgi:carotenoid cleavage dioxygenase